MQEPEMLLLLLLLLLLLVEAVTGEVLEGPRVLGLEGGIECQNIVHVRGWQ